jgi:RNA polymerase sigma-70 factor (ECF subfamily)
VASIRNTGSQKHPELTLGSILYANARLKRPVESDWVDLVRSIAAGDQMALRSLYERTHRLVFTLMVRIAKNRETAEELTVDVFHDIWRKAASYDPEAGSVVGWIMNQARSRAIDRLRFDQRKKRVKEYPAISEASDERSPHEAWEFEEQSRRLREAVQNLTAEERQVIETAFFLELSYSEAAARLSQPVGTVKTRIRSALAKLRQALSKQGGGGV